ncbi:MAG TPA: hypothetical protein EYP24_00695 [bacterium (Candidatus Stahlbacteria)]|nr:hypothetical protein [Candidatus Stahlbacteria bacterium]
MNYMSVLLLISLGGYNPTTLIKPPYRHSFGYYRASKYYLRIYLGPGFRVDNPQGVAAVKMIEEDDPRTSKDDAQLTLFAVNSGQGQIIYNCKFEAVKIYGRRGSGKGRFLSPMGIGASPTGLVCVADMGNDRVVILRYRNGKLHYESEISGLARPHDVAIDSRDRIYIANTGRSEILVYEGDSLLYRFGVEGYEPGKLHHPTAIAVIDSGARYNDEKNEFLVVIDQNRHRIQKFSLDGELKAVTSYIAIGLDDAEFSYLAIDRHGNIYATDRYNHQIHKFDHRLRYIISVGREGGGALEFYEPRGISVGRRYGQVFLTEKEGGQYLWIGIDAYLIGFFPQTFTIKRPGTTIALYITDVARLKMSIVNDNGDIIRSFFDDLIETPGEHLIVWDGRDNYGRIVPPGDYELRVWVKATYGSRFYFKKELSGRIRCVGS